MEKTIKIIDKRANQSNIDKLPDIPFFFEDTDCDDVLCMACNKNDDDEFTIISLLDGTVDYEDQEYVLRHINDCSYNLVQISISIEKNLNS
jgi:hypothetical protein